MILPIFKFLIMEKIKLSNKAVKQEAVVPTEVKNPTVINGMVNIIALQSKHMKAGDNFTVGVETAKLLVEKGLAVYK